MLYTTTRQQDYDGTKHHVIKDSECHKVYSVTTGLVC